MNKPEPVSVTQIIKENFRTKTFVTDLNIDAKPGQFIMVWVPGIAEKPFSIMESRPLSFTVASVGKFTKHLNSKMKKGNKIWFRGPLGKSGFKNKPGKKVLIAGGFGVAPLYFFAKSLRARKGVRVIIGARTKRELLFVNRFKQLGCKVIVTTDNGTAGRKGFATEPLEEFTKKEKIGCVYGCGPEPMLRAAAKFCNTYKTKYQFSLERLIKCGMGVCGSCSYGGKLICKDGPVFTSMPKQ